MGNTFSSSFSNNINNSNNTNNGNTTTSSMMIATSFLVATTAAVIIVGSSSTLWGGYHRTTTATTTTSNHTSAKEDNTSSSSSTATTTKSTTTTTNNKDHSKTTTNTTSTTTTNNNTENNNNTNNNTCNDIPTIIFVWDFDWTIINCNSDEYIPCQFLGITATKQKFRHLLLQSSSSSSLSKYYQHDWHACVEEIINHEILFNKDNNNNKTITGTITPHDIIRVAYNMPYLIPVRETIELINEYNNNNNNHQQQSSQSETKKEVVVAQMIVSDGNTLFINAFIKHNLPNIQFQYIITNTGMWIQQEDENENEINEAEKNKRAEKNGNDNTNSTTTTNNNNNTIKHNTTKTKLKIIHQSEQYGGHDCSRCSSNLCKTQALQETLKEWFGDDEDNNVQEQQKGQRQCQQQKQQQKEQQQQRRPRIIYIGDGANDACPVLNVMDHENDILLARIGTKPRNANERTGPEMDDNNDNNNNPENDKTTKKGSSNTTTSIFGIIPALQQAQKNNYNSNYSKIPKCQVWEWKTGKELKSFVQQILQEVEKEQEET